MEWSTKKPYKPGLYVEAFGYEGWLAIAAVLSVCVNDGEIYTRRVIEHEKYGQLDSIQRTPGMKGGARVMYYGPIPMSVRLDVDGLGECFVALKG